MSAGTAFLWGGFAAASLYIGELLAGPMEHAHQLTGLVMGFGAGTLLSAVAYELVPEAHLERGIWIGVWFLVGALVYYAADRIVDGRGGETRQSITGDGSGGSGAALFLGTLLDGIPESLILGITLALGGSIDVAFITAIFISNIPEGIAGTNNLKAVRAPTSAGLGIRFSLPGAQESLPALGQAPGCIAHGLLRRSAFSLHPGKPRLYCPLCL